VSVAKTTRGDAADKRRVRAHAALHRGQSVGRRLLGLTRPVDYFETSRALLNAKRGSKHALGHFLSDSIGFWLDVSSTLLGYASDSDKALHFVVDRCTESIGPRYIRRPEWMSGSRRTLLTPREVKLVGSSSTPLGPENIRIRHEDEKVSVTLVGLKTLNGLRSGKYRMVFGKNKRIEFSIARVNRAGAPPDARGRRPRAANK
jgi:hypothetical protein